MATTVKDKDLLERARVYILTHTHDDASVVSLKEAWELAAEFTEEEIKLSSAASLSLHERAERIANKLFAPFKNSEHPQSIIELIKRELYGLVPSKSTAPTQTAAEPKHDCLVARCGDQKDCNEMPRPSAEINPWKDAIIDAHVVNFSYRKEHEDNPKKALSDLIGYEVELALDPKISESAQKLIDLGKSSAEMPPLTEMEKADLRYAIGFLRSHRIEKTANGIQSLLTRLASQPAGRKL
jgi:hypothetical protein